MIRSRRTARVEHRVRKGHIGWHGEVWLRKIGSLLLYIAAASVLALPAHAASPELDRGYRNMYNLDFAAAHNDFQSWMSSHPDDPLGPVSDAAAFLFAEFDRLGVLDIELFSDDDRFVNRKRPTPNPQLRASFDQRTQQADALADAALRKDPHDANALYAKTLTLGLRSDFAALIDKSDLTALKLTKQGSELAAQTLQADPQLYDAHLAAGVENYMLSLKAAPIRWMIHITGGATDKAKGIAELKLTAEHGHYLSPFARLMLSVAELRDGNKEQAKKLLGGLAEEFPKNTLYRRQLDRIH
jgi:hypothetical protein